MQQGVKINKRGLVGLVLYREPTFIHFKIIMRFYLYIYDNKNNLNELKFYLNFIIKIKFYNKK